MDRNKTKRTVGLCAVSFGLGVFASYFLSGLMLACVLALTLVVSGIMLIGDSR